MIEIVFDHDDWLVACKPVGTNFHTEDGELGFVVQLEQQLNIKLWPVHRLDKLTSGLLILAKSKQSCANLSELFAKRNVEKYYLAICESGLKKKQGLVKGDMSPARRGGFKLLKTSLNPAVTQLLSTNLKPGYRLCVLKPKTGKTHQLRVTMKSLSSPIVGDTLYGGTSSDRLYLHSYVLKFVYKGVEFCIHQLPKATGLFDFKNEGIDEKWLTPWLLDWPKV